jgi:uncharacterized membrane protein
MPRNPPINHSMGAIEWLLLLTLSVLWGGTFLFSEVALEEVQPFTLVLGRVGFAAIALLIVVYATGRRMPSSWAAWGPFLLMGALNNLIPFSLIFWGQIEITASLASILNATTPLFTVLLAHILTRDERITPGRLAGVVLGIAGVVAMIGPAALHGLGLHLQEAQRAQGARGGASRRLDRRQFQPAPVIHCGASGGRANYSGQLCRMPIFCACTGPGSRLRRPSGRQKPC